MVHSVPPEQRSNQRNGDSVCFLLCTAKTAMKMESVAPASRLHGPSAVRRVTSEQQSDLSSK